MSDGHVFFIDALATQGPAVGAAVKGLLLGFGAAVPPGPVNLEIARRTTRGGFWAGATVGLGAVTVDVCFAVLLSLGVLQIIDSTPWIAIPVHVIGIALLLFLAQGALGNAVARLRKPGKQGLDNRPAAPSARAGYVTGVAMCVTSPYQALFWLTVVPGVLSGPRSTDVTLADGVTLCAGVFIATLTWVVSFAGLLAGFRTLDRREWLPFMMDGVGGLLLLGFAGRSIWKLGTTVL